MPYAFSLTDLELDRLSGRLWGNQPVCSSSLGVHTMYPTLFFYLSSGDSYSVPHFARQALTDQAISPPCLGISLIPDDFTTLPPICEPQGEPDLCCMWYQKERRFSPHAWWGEGGGLSNKAVMCCPVAFVWHLQNGPIHRDKMQKTGFWSTCGKWVLLVIDLF